MFAGEELSGPAKTGGDFVGDEEGAVAGAELADAADELVLGDDGAKVADDRLHNERGNIALLQQRLDLAEGLVVQRRLNLVAVRQKVLERVAVTRCSDTHRGYVLGFALAAEVLFVELSEVHVVGLSG